MAFWSCASAFLVTFKVAQYTKISVCRVSSSTASRLQQTYITTATEKRESSLVDIGNRRFSFRLFSPSFSALPTIKYIGHDLFTWLCSQPTALPQSHIYRLNYYTHDLVPPFKIKSLNDRIIILLYVPARWRATRYCDLSIDRVKKKRIGRANWGPLSLTA